MVLLKAVDGNRVEKSALLSTKSQKRSTDYCGQKTRRLLRFVLSWIGSGWFDNKHLSLPRLVSQNRTAAG